MRHCSSNVQTIHTALPSSGTLIRGIPTILCEYALPGTGSRLEQGQRDHECACVYDTVLHFLACTAFYFDGGVVRAMGECHLVVKLPGEL